MRVSRTMCNDDAVQQHIIQAWLDGIIQQKVRYKNKAVECQRQTDQFHANGPFKAWFFTTHLMPDKPHHEVKTFYVLKIIPILVANSY